MAHYVNRPPARPAPSAMTMVRPMIAKRDRAPVQPARRPAIRIRVTPLPMSRSVFDRARDLLSGPITSGLTDRREGCGDDSDTGPSGIGAGLAGPRRQPLGHELADGLQHPRPGAALRSGYGSTETLRRAFISHLGISPRAYQQRFRSALRN